MEKNDIGAKSDNCEVMLPEKIVNTNENKDKWHQKLNNVLDYFYEFCRNSSLHGIQYIGDQRRHLIEKIWWSLLFAVSVICCSLLILKTYEKWQSAPVIVSFAKTPTPIYAIPFPSVTICPETKVRQSLHNTTTLLQKLKNSTITDAEKAVLDKILLVCEELIYEGNQTVDDDIIEFFVNAAPQFETIFQDCTWNNEEMPCKDLLEPTMNNEGICYTFNMFSVYELFTKEVVFFGNDSISERLHRDWSMETGYSKNFHKDTFPKRVISSGTRTGLKLTLKTIKKDLDYLCNNPVQGFKVMLHQPGELARGSHHYHRASLDQDILVTVLPDMITTSSSLRHYGPAQRNCYFQEERYLRFFQNYTQQNCEIECITNATLEICKCVAFHMPKANGTKFCGSKSLKCMEDVEDAVLSNDFSSIDSNFSKNYLGECNCMPACHSLSYNAEISQAPLEWSKVSNKRTLQPMYAAVDKLEVHYTSLSIFFKTNHFISKERNELYGSTDFLANCGGIFSLFTGFSLLSFLEIIYYLTIRWVFKEKKLETQNSAKYNGNTA